MTLPQMNRALEELIQRPREGDGGRYALIESMLEAMLVVPSGGDMISGEGSFQPVLVEKDGQTYVVVYTSAEAAQKTREMAPFGMTMTGADVVRQLSPKLGLVVSSGKGDLALEARFLQVVRGDLQEGRAGKRQH